MSAESKKQNYENLSFEQCRAKVKDLSYEQLSELKYLLTRALERNRPDIPR